MTVLKFYEKHVPEKQKCISANQEANWIVSQIKLLCCVQSSIINF